MGTSLRAKRRHKVWPEALKREIVAACLVPAWRSRLWHPRTLWAVGAGLLVLAPHIGWGQADVRLEIGSEGVEESK